MAYSDIKRQDLYAGPKKQNGIIKFVMTTATKLVYGSNKVKYIYERMDHPDFIEPHIVLCNHMNRLDFLFLTSKFRRKRKFNYVISIDGVMDADVTIFLQEFIMRNYGAIIKRKFTNDLRLIKNIKKSVKELEQDMIMYPEARYTLEGRLSTLPESLGKMIKLFGIPVETCTMHGNYIKTPQWHKRNIKDKIELIANVKGLLTKEEIESMSVSEINDAIKNALYFNEYDFIKENNILIKDTRRAEGLHRILYQCPCCGEEFTMDSQGTKIWCNHCHKEWTYNEDATLSGDVFTSVTKWFDWERANVIKQIETGDYSFEDEVNVYGLPNTKKWRKLGTGKLTHDVENGYTLTYYDEDKEIKIVRKPTEMYSCHIEYDYRKCGDCLDISTDEDTFFVNPINFDNVLTKFHFATEEIYRYHKRLIKNK